MRSLAIFALGAMLAMVGKDALGQSATFDFESGGDQGWGHKFSDDASETFPIVNIAGSNRLEVLRNGDFQEAERASGNTGEAFFIALNAASANEAGYLLSYDWYVNTAPGNFGNFLQIGAYVNSGSGYYAQDFGAVKDVDLNGTQLGSGQVFSGTVSEMFSAKGFDLPTAQTFLRMGLIVNGDGVGATVYFDNVSITPIPEPATLSLVALAALGLALVHRRK